MLISAIKSCTDNEARYAMMHIAEEYMINSDCIVPLYFYTDVFMIKNNVQGFFTKPLGYKEFKSVTISE